MPESVTVTADAPVKPRVSVKSVVVTAVFALVAFEVRTALSPLVRSLVDVACAEFAVALVLA